MTHNSFIILEYFEKIIEKLVNSEGNFEEF